MSPKRTLAVALTLASLVQPARACVGEEWDHYILMPKVPPAAEGSSIIASVQILGVEKLNRWLSIARGRVLMPVKGVGIGEVISILAWETSCGGGMNDWHVGREGFVVGEIDPSSGLLIGTWNDRALRAGREKSHPLHYPLPTYMHETLRALFP